jgi:hypothetical protein
LKKLSGHDASGQLRGLGELYDPRCPVCARTAEASRAAVARLLELSTDAAWSAALGTGEICLDDIYALSAAAAGGPKEAFSRWSAILTAQMKRLDGLQKLLAEYAHNSTSDRRHLITREQQEAGAASIRLFSGTADRDRTR